MQFKMICSDPYQVKMENMIENIAVKLKVVEDWAILEQISCTVTDITANMLAATMGWRNLPFFAHTNLVVQEDYTV